jgi:ATP-dependent Lon protease
MKERTAVEIQALDLSCDASTMTKNSKDPFKALQEDLAEEFLLPHGIGTAPTDPSEEDLQIPAVLNVLPLRESVIYPMLIAPLSVSRAPSLVAIDDAVNSNDRIMAVLTQRQPDQDDPEPNDLYDIGCAVVIRTMVKSGEATRLIVQGLKRIRVKSFVPNEPYHRVEVEVLEESVTPEGKEEEVEALRRSISAVFDQAVRLSPFMPDDLRSLTQAVHNPSMMTDLIAAHMSMQAEEKQRILEILPLLDRQRALLSVLSREVRVMELSTKVHNEVTQELTKSQRDYYLREQLKAIQRELGEYEERGEEIDEMRARIIATPLPAEAKKEVQREFDRLRKIHPGSPEHTVARTYLDHVLSLPWGKYSKDSFSLFFAEEVLNTEHYGLEKVKERIIEFLAVRKVKGEGPIRQPILCFVGPPGVGKTSLGRSIATAMGRKYVRISLGGVRDEAEIRGHRRTYIGAMPGQIINGLKRAESSNPVFVLDEIDKLASDFRGDPASALLEVLDPEQNNKFRDHYLDVPYDLSNVFFIATANSLDTIPRPLMDRMEIIELGGYTEEEKFEIAKRHLIRKQISEHGLTKSKIAFEDSAIRKIVRHYTREAGVRNLEREIGKVVRKVTRKFAEDRKSKFNVTASAVEQLIGAPKYLHDEIGERILGPGSAVGLAWTAVGGDVLFIESALMPGKGLTLTGQLGDVMKESVTAALSFLKANAETYNIDLEKIEKSEIHVHVPAGAVPKDGPSAGVTMLTALASLLTGIPVRERLAMTGEITLTGQVLPVGGIKDKVLAAHRAGVTHLLLPDQNRKDFTEDVPLDVQAALNVTFVRQASEVLHFALGK